MPRWAASKKPFLAAIAPVKAPRGVAEELRLDQALGERRAVHRQKGPCLARAARKCSARATSSLPVPLSPWIRTLASEWATVSMSL